MLKRTVFTKAKKWEVFRHKMMKKEELCSHTLLSMYLTQPANLIGYVNHNNMYIQLAISKRILCLVSMHSVSQNMKTLIWRNIYRLRKQKQTPSNLADGGSFCVFSSQFLMTAKNWIIVSSSFLLYKRIHNRILQSNLNSSTKSVYINK